MSAADEQVPLVLTTAELERTMRELGPMYDMVRVVNPSITEGRTLDETGGLTMPHRCYDILCKGRRCKNCISARTVSCHNSVSKFEFVDDDAYYISTRYIEVDGEPRSLELIKKISDDLLFPSSDSAASAARRYLEEDSDRRYSDTITNAYNRRYLDEGISDLKGSELAILYVSDLKQVSELGGQQARDHVLATIADSVLGSIRNVDTLIRAEEDIFVIIFEGIPRNLFDTRLSQIRDNAIRALADCLVAPNINLTIGAVIREGSLQQLTDRAHEALEQALQLAEPVVLFRDDNKTASDTERDEGAPKSAGSMHDNAPLEANAGVQSLNETEELSDALVPVSTAGSHHNMVDALTGLPLSAVFRVQLQMLIDHLHDDRVPLQVVHFDIENFKAYNRAYGLQEGDLLLTKLSNGLLQEFPNELISRSGVDMFDLVTRSREVEAHIAVLRELLQTLRRDVAVDLKAGICEVRKNNLSATIAVDRAKIACDSIKGKFDRTIRYFDNRLERHIHLRDYVVKSLDTAIEQNYIEPYYQGIVRSFTGQVCSLEALSRWNDPEHGLLSPADVIPTLERHHLIHKHDIHIVNCVCRDMRDSFDAGAVVAPVSVNLSRLDFELCDIFEEVEKAVTRYHIPRSMLGIEITESALDTSNSFFRPQIERFRKAGYEIWMDDFGSGYSSLNLLKDYEFDVLKIDMAFLRGFDENQSAREILSSIVDMAKRLGIRTLAEGVETSAQYSFLRNIGCEMIQGYLFFRPMPLSQLNLGTKRSVETPEERDFLDAVGRVNMLSQEPTETIRMGPHQSEPRGLPLVLLEWDGAKLHFFAANESYLRRIHNKGFADMDEVESWFNGENFMDKQFEKIAQKVRQQDFESMVSYHMGDDTHTISVQFVARSEHASAYLITPLVSTAVQD